MTHARTAPLLLSLSLALVPAAAARAQEASSAQVREEIEFARGLADEWGFVDIAEEVIRQVEREKLPDKLREELGLLQCEIYFIAGKADPARRDELLRRSLSCYEDFVARNAYSQFKVDAEAALVNVAGVYARSLALRMEDAAGEEATKLREELQGVLGKAISKTGDLIDALRSVPKEERSEAEDRRLYQLLLDRGDMLLELAKSKEAGAFDFEQSLKAYEDLVDEAGEATPWGLRGFIGLGDNYAAQGEWQSAADFYEFVVDLAIPRVREDWEEARKEMTLEEVERRFLFVQLGTPGLVRAYLQAGEPGEAAAWGLHFYNVWRREGLNLMQPIGHLALLAVARTLVDAGGFVGGDVAAGDASWYPTREAMQAAVSAARLQRTAVDLALSMATNVNRENQGNTLQIRAQKVIAEIITRPGVEVDPEILFEAAQGEYYDRNFAAAVTAFKRVLASLEHADASRKQLLGPKVLFHIGRSFQRMERPLEAAVTFQQALTERWRGDPEFDSQNARQFYDTMNQLKRQARGDPVIESLWRESELAAATFSEGRAQAEIAWRQAERSFQDGSFEEARRLFREVPPGADSYEKAIVFDGIAAFEMEQYPEAIEVFDRYLSRFLTDPVNTTTDAVKLAKRSEATAAAYFYWGRAAAKLGEWQTVVEKLSNFHERFPQQTSLAPRALLGTMLAHQHMGDRQSAARVYQQLLQAFPEDRVTGSASIASYTALEELHGAEQDPAKKRALLREMAENLQVSNRTSSSPSYANLRKESQHWMVLGEWKTAEALLGRIVDKFGADPANQEQMDKFVLPDLGLALARQHQVREAAEILGPLVERKVATRDTAHTYARVLAGWAELKAPQDGGRAVIEQVPGVGGEEAFREATTLLNQLAESSESWQSDAWYDYKFDMFYAYYQWGQIDGKKLEYVKSEFNKMATALGGPIFPLLREQGREAAQVRYQWLAEQLR